jgi:hypothetical protein
MAPHTAQSFAIILYAVFDRCLSCNNCAAAQLLVMLQ